MASRADKYTQLKKEEQFSDFLNNFSLHPVTGSLAKTTNEFAVRQSIKNLILTDQGERLFQPNIGSDIRRSLFEPLDRVVLNDIREAISSTIKYNEPRARLLDVLVTGNEDSNELNVTILFSLINSNTPISLDVILRRVR